MKILEEKAKLNTILNRPHIEFSVIMSVYDEPISWLEESIMSILNQTFTHFEFIIINDNPIRLKNNEILESYKRKDNRIIVVNNENNLGLTKSLNKGLKLAQGKYIARMDADDISLPHRLAVQYEYMENTPSCIACGTWAYSCNNRKKTNKTISLPVDFDTITTHMFTSSPFIHSSLIFRNCSVKYDESYAKAQDYKLAIDISLLGEIRNIPKPLLYYRHSTSQITNKYAIEQKECAKKIRREYIKRFYNISTPKLILGESIALKDIISNEQNEKILLGSLDGTKRKNFKRNMNAIRRILYCSLNKYSYHSFIHYIFSFDYFKAPYNFRRFIVAFCHFFGINLQYKLL